MTSLISLQDLNTSIDNEPRIYDVRLAEALGYSDPKDIRELISRHHGTLIKFGEISPYRTEKLGRGRPSEGYALNEKQCLYLCTKSETERAVEVTINMVEVYYQFRHGQLSTEPATITRSQAGEITQLILERAGDDKSSIPYFRARFKNHFRLASYKDLPAAKFEEACAYIQTMPDKAVKALPASDKETNYRALLIEMSNVAYEIVDDLKYIQAVDCEHPMGRRLIAELTNRSIEAHEQLQKSFINICYPQLEQGGKKAD